MQTEHPSTEAYTTRPDNNATDEIPAVELTAQRVTHIASADSPWAMIRSFGSNDTSSITSDNFSRSSSDNVLQSGTLNARATQATSQHYNSSPRLPVSHNLSATGASVAYAIRKRLYCSRSRLLATGVTGLRSPTHTTITQS